jgi:pimeloyl-[acyl-carrier protein] methyl ester esterase
VPGGTRSALSLSTRVAGAGGRSILLVHGWSYHGGIWGYEVAALGDDWRLVIPDLPGHGRTPLRTSGRPIRETAVQGLGQVWRDHHLGGSLVIGWALGAQLVVDAIAAGAIDPSSALLVALPTPAGAVPDPRRGPLWRDWPRYSLQITRMMVARPLSPESERWLGRMAADASLAAAGGFLADGWRPPGRDFRLPERSVLVHGRLDPIAPCEPAVELASAWGADVHVLDDVAHCPFLEDRTAYARVRDDWLEAA